MAANGRFVGPASLVSSPGPVPATGSCQTTADCLPSVYGFIVILTTLGKLMAEKAQARVMSLDQLEFTPRFEYGDQAQVAALVGAEDGSKLGVGLVRMTQAEIPWTIKYDEFVLVLEGTFTVTTESGDLTARAMEAIWLPAGTSLTYRGDKVLLLYAIHPTDWSSQDHSGEAAANSR